MELLLSQVGTGSTKLDIREKQGFIACWFLVPGMLGIEEIRLLIEMICSILAHLKLPYRV